MKHSEIVHISKKYKCDFCDFSTNRKTNLTKHLKTVHNIQTERKNNEEKETNMHKKTKLLCMECLSLFDQLKNLNRHILSVHRGIDFNCDECGISFSRADNFSRHKKRIS